MMTDAERTLIHEALRFAVWAAGEGIAPAKVKDARCPEDFLFDYSLETDETDWETLPDRVIAALEAQLAERAGGVKVRDLEWKTLREGESYGAFGAGITYRVVKAALSATAWSWYRLGAHQNECESFEAAKAAAQADHERRILSALEPAAPIVNRPTHCGGCGETDPAKRCIGCLADFGPAAQRRTPAGESNAER